MRRILLPLAASALMAAALSGCRTSEANYRAAYERTVAGRDSAMSVDSTIYGAVRRQMDMRTVPLADGTSVPVYSQHVRVTDGGGGTNEALRRYNVVVGRFKQLFNARSMRERLVDNGVFPGAFVVETAEPYYYVVGASTASPDSAAAILRNLPTGTPPMRDPLPLILDATQRRQRR